MGSNENKTYPPSLSKYVSGNPAFRVRVTMAARRPLRRTTASFFTDAAESDAELGTSSAAVEATASYELPQIAPGRLLSAIASSQPVGTAPHDHAGESATGSRGRVLYHVMSMEELSRVASLRNDTTSRAAGVPLDRVAAGMKRGAAERAIDGSGLRKKAYMSTAVSQPIVLVKIGADGLDSRIPIMYDSLVDMDRMALLEELSKSVRFSTKLKDVPLDDCTVWLLPRVAGDEPTLAEEDAAVELRAAASIGDLLAQRERPPPRLLFIRVRTPPSHTPAGVPRGWTAVAADHEWSLLVSAIRNKRWRWTRDGHVELTAPGVMWPDLNSPLLFVRCFYKDLYEGVMKGFSKPEMLYQVSGQPGIGKSAFGLYAVFRALTVDPPRSVVYAAHKLHTCFAVSVASAGEVPLVLSCPVVGHDIQEISPLLLRRSSLFILDGCRLQARQCTALQIASPRLLRVVSTRDETNQNTLQFTVPMYTTDEVLQLRAVAFPEVTEADAAIRMPFWGPSPRLALALSAAEQRRRVKQVSTVDVTKVATQEAADVCSAEVQHMVFIQHCEGQVYDSDNHTGAFAPPTPHDYGYYLPGPVTWSSWPIAHHVLKRASRLQAAQLLARAHVAQWADQSILSVMSGDLFEGLVAYTLHAGGTFTMAAAGAGSRNKFKDLAREDIDVHASDVSASFASAAELKKLLDARKSKDAEDSSFVLHASNRKECAIDGIIKTTTGRYILYNATFAGRHSIMLSNMTGTGGVIPIAEALGLLTRDAVGQLRRTSKFIDLAFIVPCATQPRFNNIQIIDDANVDNRTSKLVCKALRQHIIMLQTRVVPLQESTTAPDAAASAALPPSMAASSQRVVSSLEDFDAWLVAKEHGS